MEKKKIYFITGNRNKFNEAKAIIPELEKINLDLPEIQETDPQKIINAKLYEAFKFKKNEFVVEDTSLFFECMGELPGPLIKWFLKSMGNDGLFDIVSRYRNSNAKCLLSIGYINFRREIFYFTSSLKGKIVAPAGKHGFGWDAIFVPIGFEKTFSEMKKEEKNNISMRSQAFKKLKYHLLNSI